MLSALCWLGACCCAASADVATKGVLASMVDPSAQPAVRRNLTLLFSDICGSTSLAATMEAEEYAEILREFGLACNLVLPRHGGTIARVQGDGVLAIYGLPEVLADDGRRAAEAALELHAAVRELQNLPSLPGSREVRLHTGIHAGLVLMAPGDLMRGRFELSGNTPNVAARLAALAQADEILVSD
ncbi:MAG: adenylate/guanylate cyclase domain-containing protein, partial [Burkholderiaceae bacterium]